MARPLHQTVFYWISWPILGAVAVGAFLDAWNNVSILSPSVTYFGSAAILGIWIVVELIVRIKRPYWSFSGGTVLVQRLGLRPRLMMLGSILLLWSPRFIELSPAPSRARINLELMLYIGGFEMRVTNQSTAVVAEDIHLDLSAWTYGSPGANFRRSTAVRDLGPRADFVVQRPFGEGGSHFQNASTNLSGYVVASCKSCDSPRAWAFFLPEQDEGWGSFLQEHNIGGDNRPWPIAEFQYPEQKPGIGSCVDYFKPSTCSGKRSWNPSRLLNH